MTGYTIVNLAKMINVIGEERVKEILSSYRCPLNKDVENYLHNTAIEFAKQSIAATYLVYAPFKGDNVLVGYFTLADKILVLPNKSLSSSLQKRIRKFAQPDITNKSYILSAPLIAQLGKNYLNNYGDLISGDELLKMACERIFNIQIQLSGKVTYVECTDEEKLINFYTSNGFVSIGRRYLKKCERNDDTPEYFVQLIKYLDHKQFQEK